MFCFDYRAIMANFAKQNIFNKAIMVKHIVLFRFRDDIAEEQKNEVFESFSKGILSLVGIIPQIKKIEVGRNANPSEAWDICLCGEFDSLEDVNIYANNPEHIKVAGALKPFLAGRSCVDYETSEP